MLSLFLFLTFFAAPLIAMDSDGEKNSGFEIEIFQSPTLTRKIKVDQEKFKTTWQNLGKAAAYYPPVLVPALKEMATTQKKLSDYDSETISTLKLCGWFENNEDGLSPEEKIIVNASLNIKESYLSDPSNPNKTINLEQNTFNFLDILPTALEMLAHDMSEGGAVSTGCSQQ